jgi:hypothetical protein
MAYYIFLKSLRSLEEFRKNPHVKIPPNLLVQISKALVNSKIQFLIQNFFFFAFGPVDLAAHSASGPAGPCWPLFSCRLKPTGRPKPLGPRVLLAYLQKYAFSFDSRLPLSAPSLYPPLTHGPRLSVPSSPPRRPTPAVNPPRRRSPRRPLRASDAVKPLPPPSSFPPLIPFELSINGLSGYSSLPLLRPPPRCPPSAL